MGVITFVNQDAASWASAPAAWNTIRTNVCNELVANLAPSQNITVTINWGYGDVGGSPLTGGAPTTQSILSFHTYAAVRGALVALTPNNLQSTAYNSTNLPATDPFGTDSSTQMQLTKALVKAISLDVDDAFIDAHTGFPTTGWDITSLDGTSCAAGQTTLYQAMYHEVTEALGRILYADTQSGTYQLGDIFTYSAASTRNITSSGTRYLSHDGGTTNLCTLGQSGDRGDTTSPQSAINEDGGGVNFIPVPHPVTDWKFMTLIGWGLTTLGLSNAGLSTSFPMLGMKDMLMMR